MTALDALFDDSVDLPSPPAVAMKILNAVQQDNASFNQIGTIISADPALTSQILKIANSSLYGRSRRIESLAQATALLGTKALRNIALSFVIVKNFEDVAENGFDLQFFWRHSITTAVAAELLSALVKHAAEDIFVAALLQDIGVLILCLSHPEVVQQLLDEKRVSGTSYWETELKINGYTHADIGYRLLESWNLPASICEPIRDHHRPGSGAGRYADSARILGWAEKISSLYHGSDSCRKSKQLSLELSERYGLAKDQVEELIDLVGEKSREMIDVFSIEPGDIKPFSQIMQEANDELRRLNFSYEEVVLELKQAKQSVEKLAVELQRTNEKLRQLAFRDELTGLYNHRYFQEALDAELARAERYRHPLSLLLIDLDYFKRVNDTYGHLVGDHVLQEIGRVMVKLVRQCDIVARYGGEEFAVILPETGASRAKIIGQRILRGVEQAAIKHKNHTLSVTVSIGGASTDMATIGSDKTALIAHSDNMLYAAKKNGRNRVAISSKYHTGPN